MTSLASPLGRVLISAIFILAGYEKLIDIAGTKGYMESAGAPGILAYAVIALELGGGILILLGWFTKITAFLLAGFCVLTAVLFHFNFADQMQSILFMKNLAIAGGMLFLVANGPGPLSIDKN